MLFECYGVYLIKLLMCIYYLWKYTYQLPGVHEYSINSLCWWQNLCIQDDELEMEVKMENWFTSSSFHCLYLYRCECEPDFKKAFSHLTCTYSVFTAREIEVKIKNLSWFNVFLSFFFFSFFSLYNNCFRKGLVPDAIFSSDVRVQACF